LNLQEEDNIELSISLYLSLMSPLQFYCIVYTDQKKTKQKKKTCHRSREKNFIHVVQSANTTKVLLGGKCLEIDQMTHISCISNKTIVPHCYWMKRLFKSICHRLVYLIPLWLWYLKLHARVGKFIRTI